jgi:hypothetical protein
VWYPWDDFRSVIMDERWDLVPDSVDLVAGGFSLATDYM